MKILCVIPARYGSERLPGKPLIEIEGLSLIQRVYERAKKVKSFTDIVVATDDVRIFKHVEEFGGRVLMTRTDHKSGTERMLEVAGRMEPYDIYVNVQGDEPLIPPEMLHDISLKISDTSKTAIYTAATTIEEDEIHDPNVVKLITDVENRAHLFSRAPIPFSKTGQWIASYHQRHIGVYFFTAAAIQIIKTLKAHPFEEYESLEQLRWLLNGLPIFVHPTHYKAIGVDTKEDIEKVKRLLLEDQGAK